MPRVSEMIESSYLRKEDIDTDTVVTIRKIGRKNVAPDGQPEELKWCVKFDEFKKLMVLNPTNIQLMAKACGSEDTDDWLDKKVILYVDDNVQFQGKLVGGLRIRRRQPAPRTIDNSMMDDEPRPAAQAPAAKPKGTFDDMDDDIPF